MIANSKKLKVATLSLTLVSIFVTSTLCFGLVRHAAPERSIAAQTPPALLRDDDAPAWKGEPVVRVGLATDLRTATVSTADGSLVASIDDGPAQHLAASRVKLEPRSLLPSAPAGLDSGLVVAVSGLRTHDEARVASQDITSITGESIRTVSAPDGSWRIDVGAHLTEGKARSIKAILEEQGFLASIATASTTAQSRDNSSPSGSTVVRPTQSTSLVRTVSRISAPSRETVAYDQTSARLFSSRAPLLFSGGTAQSYVKFNDKPYRGQLEVFANPRGTLTVVNVVTLEDYVRGVVPNELSPEAFPEIEALKAQAVAARTYAIKHRDQFASQGFDILPTTQSQVYGGLASERQLANRAVDETRGLIATYAGQPIDALYTSTCGGRTEDAANIFGGNEVPYLRGRECAVDGATVFAPFVLKSSRDQAEIRDERNAELPHDLGVLGVNQFELPRRISDAWLLAMPSSSEAQSWLASAARAAHQNGSAPVDDISRLPGFSSALVVAVFGERRGDVLLDNADVDYLLPFRDSAQIPAANRTDVALLAREGAISPYPDASLRPRETLSRARMLHAIARLLERHNLLQLQKGTARPSTGGELIIRSAKNRDLALTLAGDAFLLRALSGAIFQVKSIPVIGGESILFHSTRSGQVDFLEVQPPPNGAAADRFSSFSNWSTSMTLGEIQGRLSGATRGIGNLMDLRVAARGSSRRVTDLELKGSAGTSHLRGGRIRSALGLREQLFVIDRDFNSDGRLVGFTFVGRGYGHGVGLCQVGAYGLAREGYTYDKILKAYYAGIDLKRLY